MKKKVMVAIDESECSHYALEWALDNLKDMIAGSELVVFCVQSLTNMGYVYASSLVHAETLTEVGDPKEAICEAVDNLNVQLLVLGSHSRGTIQRAFLGSVSNYCVHNSKVPSSGREKTGLSRIILPSCKGRRSSRIIPGMAGNQC
ncbi:hypothetical protein SAY87_001921 [Trapa incisa]|uniref:UspA domain-containing protein n=1 Tax=Trapa incisa TaxID=236973 RepID=A0AAN7JV23_9MYRT|nr:hypothetical protein SAY87_001921 [Trapa incisa]